jgi:predicted mannosyl-3-phosphoglycerate phosphatase (HAD superfamily)
MLDSNNTVAGFAKGGLAEHKPEFITGATGHHVKGEGDGQSDSIPAMLADGEYVFDADTVAALGNGSNDAGAAVLDKMRQNLRKHKRSAPAGKIPPKAKSPLEYMKG